jgi:hypothetical protein
MVAHERGVVQLRGVGCRRAVAPDLDRERMVVDFQSVYDETRLRHDVGGALGVGRRGPDCPFSSRPVRRLNVPGSAGRLPLLLSENP